MSDPATKAEMRSPLHSFGLAAAAKPVDDRCGVWADELRLAGIISLRGEVANSAFATAAAKALGTSLPTQPCTFTEVGDIRIYWLSPDEWMIALPRARRDAMLAALKAALVGIRSQVVDNSGGYTEVAILGRDAEAVMSHCTVYDLHALTAGRVVGTTFGKASAFMRRDGDGFRIIIRRSFADYIWRFLVRAAKPYGFGVAKLGTGASQARGAA